MKKTTLRHGQIGEQIAERRAAAIDAAISDCLQRSGGAALCVIAKSKALLVALFNRGLMPEPIDERATHLPERMHGARLAIESIVEELGLECVAAKHCGEFDAEQFEHDLKTQVTRLLRELI